MKDQRDEKIIPVQITKNYFRKGVKAKGVRRVFEALVNLKENYVSGQVKKILAEKKINRELLRKKKNLNKPGQKILQRDSRSKKKEEISDVIKFKLFRAKARKKSRLSTLVSYRVAPRFKSKKDNRFRKIFHALRERGCFADWILRQALSNCRWRVFLRSRWVAGKRMKVPFFTSLLRDTRYACKNLVKSVTDKAEKPFLPGLVKELHLSLIFKSITVKKRVVAYRTLYNTSLYTGSGYKTVKKRKKINRY